MAARKNFSAGRVHRANEKPSPEERLERQLENAVSVCSCFNIRKVSRAVTQHYDNHLRPSGLRSTQFSMLAAVLRAGPASQKNLARSLGMDHSTLTRNLRPLVDSGFVESVPGQDRRTRELRVTPAGKEALKNAAQYWQQAQNNLTAGLGPQGINRLNQALKETLAAARGTA